MTEKMSEFQVWEEEQEQLKRDAVQPEIDAWMKDNPNAPSPNIYNYHAAREQGGLPDGTDAESSWLNVDHYQPEYAPKKDGPLYNANTKQMGYQQAPSYYDQVIENLAASDDPREKVIAAVPKMVRDAVQGNLDLVARTPYRMAENFFSSAAAILRMFNDAEGSDVDTERLKTDPDYAAQVWDIEHGTLLNNTFDEAWNERLQLPQIEAVDATNEIISEIGALLLDFGMAEKVVANMMVNPAMFSKQVQKWMARAKTSLASGVGETAFAYGGGSAGNFSTMLREWGFDNDVTQYLDSTMADDETDMAMRNFFDGLGFGTILELGAMGIMKGIPAIQKYAKGLEKPAPWKVQEGAVEVRGVDDLNLRQDQPIDELPKLPEEEFPYLPTDKLNRADQIYDGQPMPTKVTKKNQEVATQLDAEAKEAWGGQAMEYTPENIHTVAGNMADEVEAVARHNPDAVGWYKANLDRAIKSATKVFPELATDADALWAFKTIKAITSNGQKVKANAQNTERLYRHYRRTGEFLPFSTGKQGQAMKKSFKMLNHLLTKEKIAPTDLEVFMRQKITVRELNKLNKKWGIAQVSGEKLDTEVYGSSILGPKIGNGFWQNLSGNYNVPTFDLWWQRTWGRHTGTLLFSPEQVGKSLTTLNTALGNKVKTIEKMGFDLTAAKAAAEAGDPSEMLDIAKAIAKKQDDKYKKAPRGQKPDKTELESAALSYVEKMEGHVQTPRGGGERNYMRDAYMAIQEQLSKRGLDIDLADIQAALWYAEKDLYGKMGARHTTEKSDYASVWNDIERAYSGTGGSGGRQPISGSSTGSNSRSDKGRSGKESGQ